MVAEGGGAATEGVRMAVAMVFRVLAAGIEVEEAAEATVAHPRTGTAA